MKTFTKMVCALLDIPVHDNPIESLHLLFSLYAEFKSNPFFKHALDVDAAAGSGGGSYGNSTRASSAAREPQASGSGSGNVMSFS